MARLQRLARFYRVPVDQMLPHDDELGLPSANGNAPVVDLTERVRRRPVTLDLQAIEQTAGHEGEMLRRYLRLIQWQRGDYNGRMLTIRRDDLSTGGMHPRLPPRAGARPARRPRAPPGPMAVRAIGPHPRS